MIPVRTNIAAALLAVFGSSAFFLGPANELRAQAVTLGAPKTDTSLPARNSRAVYEPAQTPATKVVRSQTRTGGDTLAQPEYQISGGSQGSNGPTPRYANVIAEPNQPKPLVKQNQRVRRQPAVQHTPPARLPKPPAATPMFRVASTNPLYEDIEPPPPILVRPENPPLYDPIEIQSKLESDLKETLLPTNASVVEYTQQAHQVQQGRGLLGNHIAVPVTPGDAIHHAIFNSFRSKVLGLQVLEAEAVIQEERGVFDWTLNLQQSFDSENTPTQTELDAGADQQTLNNDIVRTTFGSSRFNRLGGEFTSEQIMAKTETNSEFAIAPDQFSAQALIRYQQPLLRGSGLRVNTARIRIAMLDSEAARANAAGEIALRATETSAAYWQIYAIRSQIMVIEETITIAQRLQRTLEQRRELDADPFILARAKTTLASLESQRIDLHRQLIQAQLEFVRLTNNPQWHSTMPLEIIPQVVPNTDVQLAEETALLQQAFANRPELGALMSGIESAAAQLDISRNELLPALSTFVQVQASGLAESNAFTNALTQIRDGAFVGSQAGLEFELPIPNRRARGAVRQAMANYRRLEMELQEQMADVAAEVLTQVNDLKKLNAQLTTVRQQIESILTGIIALEVQRTAFAEENESPTQRLVFLLDFIEQFAAARVQYFQLLADINQSQMELSQAMGLVVEDNSVEANMQPFRFDVDSSARVATPPPPHSILTTVHDKVFEQVDLTLLENTHTH